MDGVFLSITKFDRYSRNEHCNPPKDKIFLNTMTLLMSDDEFNKSLTDLKAIFMNHLNNKPSEERLEICLLFQLLILIER